LLAFETADRASAATFTVKPLYNTTKDSVVLAAAGAFDRVVCEARRTAGWMDGNDG
jgi:hypothetical protein